MDDDLRRKILSHSSAMDLQKEWARLHKRKRQKRLLIFLLWSMVLGGTLLSYWYVKSNIRASQKDSGKFMANQEKGVTDFETCPELQATERSTSFAQHGIKKGNDIIENKENWSEKQSHTPAKNSNVSITEEKLLVSPKFTTQNPVPEATGQNVNQNEVIAFEAIALDLKTDLLELPLPEIEILMDQPQLTIPADAKDRFIVMGLKGNFHDQSKLTASWVQDYDLTTASLQSQSLQSGLSFRKSFKERFYIESGFQYNYIRDELQLKYDLLKFVDVPGQLVRINYLQNGSYIETYNNGVAGVSKKLNLKVINHFHQLDIPIRAGVNFADKLQIGLHMNMPLFQAHDYFTLGDELQPVNKEAIRFFNLSEIYFEGSIALRIIHLRKTSFYLSGSWSNRNRHMEFAGTTQIISGSLPFLGLQAIF